MEPLASFDLAPSLATWRRSLTGLAPDDIAELESHLLDSMGELQKSGLSEEEAFLIARRRLGKPEELDAPPSPSPRLGAAMFARVAGLLLIVAGCLGLLSSAALPILAVRAPKKYTATVRMEIHRNSTVTELSNLKNTRQNSEPTAPNEEFFATQLEIITAQETLLFLIKRLDLAERWKAGTPAAAYEKLKRMVSATQERGTSLVRITVTSIDKKEAAEVANGLANAYIERRKMLEQDTVDLSFQTLVAVRKGQEQAVERARNTMLQMAEQHNISDPDPEGPPYVGKPQGLSDKYPPQGQFTGYNLAKENYQQQLKVLRAMIDELEKARVTGLMPRKPATFHERATEPATYSSPRIKFWLAAALAGIPCSGLALGTGLWLRRRAATLGQ